MRTDDPRLEKAHQEMTERVRKFNELMLVVMKNHITMEQFLNDVLSAAGRPWKRRPCSGKIDIAKTLHLVEIDQRIWAVIEAGNKLRNQIAHTYDQTKLAAKMSELRKAYLAAITPEQAKHSEGLDDPRIAAGAFELCGADLVVASESVRDGQKRG